MDLNQAEVAVTTQHLIELKDNLADVRLRRHGGIPLHLLRHVPGRGEPGVQVHEMGGNPGPAHQPEWLCSNFFEIREAMEQLEEPDKDCFFDWCDRYGHDISTEDPHLLVAHYIELYGNAAYIDDEPCPDSGDDSLLYYPGISSNYFDTGIPRFEVFDDNYD